MSLRVIGLALALLAVVPAARADEVGCRKALGKAIAKYTKLRFKLIAKCEDKRSKGTLPVATVCRPQCNGGSNAGAPCDGASDCASGICDAISDVTTATKIGAAATQASSTITTGCTGPLPEIGPACDDSAATANDLVTCITSARQDENTEQINVDTLAATAYDTTAPVTDTGLLKCQATISKNAGKYLDARFKADEKCNDKLLAGKITGPCPDSLTSAKAEKARVKMDLKIRAKCSEAQLAADTNPQLTFGLPCEKYKLVTFKRPTNAIPVQDRFLGCLTDATAAVADRMVDIAYPQPETSEFRYGVAAGDMTDTSVVFWTEVPDSSQGALLEVATDAAFTTIVHSSSIPATPGAGGTVKKDVSGLTAATKYFYRFTQGAEVSETGTVKTTPSPATSATIRVGWSGDSNAFFRPYSVLDPVRQLDPDAWFFIGDTIYGDDPRADGVVSSTFADYAGKYRANRLDSSLRHMIQQVGTYSMTDDHEVRNDYSGAVPAYASKLAAGNYAFRRFNPIREDGGDPMQLYRSFKMGTLAEFFIIDGRQYRSAKYTCCNNSAESAFVTTDDDTTCQVSGEALLPLGLAPSCSAPSNSCQINLCDPSRTFLGTAQKNWLKNGIQNSTATFKFIMNGTPITQLVFQPYDRWEAWPAERDEILGFIETNAINNVIWLSTDLHGLIYSSGLNVPGALPAHPNHIEVVAGAIGMDPIFRELPPSVSGLLSTVPAVLAQVQEFDIDRFNAVLLTVAPGLPATAKVDVYDRSNTIIHSLTFNAN